MTPSQSGMASAKKGSTDLLILSLVDERPLHGYDIARLIEARSGGALRFTLASLYETLYRLEEHGHIRGRWVERAGQRRRRFYKLTPAGKKRLLHQRETWSAFMAAVQRAAGLEYA
jgi:PadR family transcriptional regulator